MESELSPPQRKESRRFVLGLLFVLTGVLGGAAVLWGARRLGVEGVILYGIHAACVVAAVLLWIYGEKGKGSSRRAFILAGLLGYLLSLASNRLNTWLEKDREPERRIVLIGEQKFAHWKSFTDGFRLVLKNHGKVGEERRSGDDPSLVGEIIVEHKRKDVVINVVTEAVPDDGDEIQNREQQRKRMVELAENPNVVMIIGFVTSTKADEALHALETSRVHDWPAVILPMATASKLVADHNPNGDRPLLRIVPPNYAQVEPMADEIVESSGGKTPVSLAIFRDRPNYTYSSDLAEALRQKTESKNVAVVFDGSIGPDGVGSYITDSFVMLRPDYIAFLGMLNTGIPLVRQIQAMRASFAEKSWNPTILLSDGSVEKKINEYARTDELKGVRGFFPHGEPLASGEVCNVDARFDNPSYTMFGHDAAVFAREILQTAVYKDPKLGRHAVAQAVKTVRDQWNKGESSIQGNVLVGQYRFNPMGDVTGLKYHVWIFDGTKWKLKPNSAQHP